MKQKKAMKQATALYEFIGADVPDSQIEALAELMIKANSLDLSIGVQMSPEPNSQFNAWEVMNKKGDQSYCSTDKWNQLEWFIKSTENISNGICEYNGGKEPEQFHTLFKSNWIKPLIELAEHYHGFLVMISKNNEHVLLNICKWHENTSVQIGFEYYSFGGEIQKGDIRISDDDDDCFIVEGIEDEFIVRLSQLLGEKPNTIRTFNDTEEAGMYLHGETSIHNVIDTSKRKSEAVNF